MWTSSLFRETVNRVLSKKTLEMGRYPLKTEKGGKKEEEEEACDDISKLSDGDLISDKSTSWRRVFFRRRGVLWALLAGFSMCLQFYVLKWFTEVSNSFQPIFNRSIFFSFMTVGIKWESSESQNTLTLILFLLCGICDGVAIVFLVCALQYLPVGDVSSITQNVPIPCAVVAALLLGEPLGTFGVLLVIINAFGLVIVSKPSIFFTSESSPEDDSDSNENILGVLLSFLSLACSVSFIILARRLASTKAYDEFLILTLSGLAGLVLSSVALTVTSSWDYPESLSEWCMSFVLGVLGVTAVGGGIMAIKTEPVLTVSVLLTICIPLSCICDVIFDQRFDWFTLSGASLIFISTAGCLFV